MILQQKVMVVKRDNSDMLQETENNNDGSVVNDLSLEIYMRGKIPLDLPPGHEKVQGQALLRKGEIRATAGRSYVHVRTPDGGLRFDKRCMLTHPAATLAKGRVSGYRRKPVWI
jgi:hypothetical protein